MKNLLATLLLFLFVTSLKAENTDKRPPLRPGRITMQFVAAGLGGFILTYGGIIAVQGLSGSSGWDALGEAIAVSLVTYPIGSAVGAHLAGTRDDETGSFGAALAGGFAGMAANIFLLRNSSGEDIYNYAIFALPPAGAVLGHVLTRRYKNPQGQALLNWEQGQLLAGTPGIRLQPVNSNGRLVPTFHLLSVQF